MNVAVQTGPLTRDLLYEIEEEGMYREDGSIIPLIENPTTLVTSDIVMTTARKNGELIAYTFCVPHDKEELTEAVFQDTYDPSFWNHNVWEVGAFIKPNYRNRGLLRGLIPIVLKASEVTNAFFLTYHTAIAKVVASCGALYVMDPIDEDQELEDPYTIFAA